jgi:hypothetical protein
MLQAGCTTFRRAITPMYPAVSTTDRERPLMNKHSLWSARHGCPRIAAIWLVPLVLLLAGTADAGCDDPAGPGVDWRGCDKRSVDLRGANLQYARLEQADLEAADLEGADLLYANIADAKLDNANLHGANLSGANLSGARLAGATWIDGLSCSARSVSNCAPD